MTSRAAFSMSDRAELWERLSITGRVLKLQQIVTWTIRLLLLGVVVDCLWLAGSRFFPYIVPPMMVPGVPLALAALGALVLAFWHPPMAYLARQTDRQLGLKERLTTAVELQLRGEGRHYRGESRGPTIMPSLAPLLADMQLRDAVEHFRRVEPVDAFPIRVRFRELNALLALSVVAVLLLALPNSMHQVVRQREQVQQTLRQEAERLTRRADELAAMNAENPSEELRQVEQALRDGARAIEERGTNEEALAALAALEQRLQALQGTGGADLEEALSALAGSLAQDPNTRQIGTSLAKGDFKQAAEEMRKLAENIDNLSAAERSRLARAMRQAGQRASRANAGLGGSMTQTANALEGGSAEEAQNALRNSASQVAGAEGQARTSGERERAMSQLQQSRSNISRAAQQAQNQGRGQSTARQPGSQSGGQPDGGEDGQGSSQQGQGQGQGQNQAQGQGQGESADGDRPGGSGAGTGANPNPQSDQVYDPVFANSRQERVESGQPFEPTDSSENPMLEDAQRNDAQVSYRQVYPRYQEKAVQSLQNSYIPIGMKDLVKDYFSSIAPQK